MGELHVEFTVCDPNRLQPTCKAAAAVEFKPREVEGTSVQEGASVRILQTAKGSYQGDSQGIKGVCIPKTIAGCEHEDMGQAV